jgi:hypothetical protein
MHEHEPVHHDREAAREALTRKIAGERKLLADPQGFSTIDPNWLIADAEWRLRWIDCAPDGANHIVAPLQDKAGVPMGTARNENVGPGRALREARAARGLHPIAGAAALAA